MFSPTTPPDLRALNGGLATSVIGAADEHARLQSLHAYAILDTGQDPAFTALAAAAAIALGTERSEITLLDAERQWRLAAHGPSLRQSPRAGSMCAEVVHRGVNVVVTDIPSHPAFSQLPLAQRIRSYAAVPILSRDGLAIGAFSVADTVPREFSPSDMALLTGLTDAATALLERRRDELGAGRSLEAGPGGSRWSPAALRRALINGEIDVLYQPVLSARTGELETVKAIARWNLPTSGAVASELLMTQLESSPLLAKAFTEYVLAKACSDLSGWRALGASILAVSIPVSSQQAQSAALPVLISSALQTYALSPDAVVLESAPDWAELDQLSARAVPARQLSQLAAFQSLLSADCLGTQPTFDQFGTTDFLSA